MDAKQYDLIIAGSGPAGISTWLHLHRRLPAVARRTLVIEKSRHPRAKTCGGGVTRRAEQILKGLDLRIAIPSAPVNDVRFRYRNQDFHRRIKSYFQVVDRSLFDNDLMEAARRRGMRIHQGEPLRTFTVSGRGIDVVTDQNQYRARALVGADGVFSAVRKGMKLAGNERFSRLIQVTSSPAPVEMDPRNTGRATFEFDGVDQGLQGYVWDFPCLVDGRPAMNRGIFDSRIFPSRPRANLRSILSRALQIRLADPWLRSWRAHPERWYDPGAEYSRPRVLLVGDAAGIEPLAGEGISVALLYGEVAAGEIASAFDHGEFDFRAYGTRIRTHRLGRFLRQRRWMAMFTYGGWHPFLLKGFFRTMGIFLS